jgi:hypothetical protein
MGIAVVTIVWFYVWLGIEPSSAFRIALAPPYVVLVNIMICRVFRNTKLGLYSKAPTSAMQSNRDSKLHTPASSNGSIPWNPREVALNPIQISVNRVVEYKSDYPPLIGSKPPAEILDFGMV